MWMWQLDCEESWAPKNWCFWSVVLEKTLESPLDCKEIQPVHSEGEKSWVFIGRTDAEAETPILWPPHVKSWLIWKAPRWEGLGAGREGDNRGWDGWMASLTRWAWVWVNSESWWWTGRPGMLWFMGSQRAGHDWVTELNWTEHWIENPLDSKETKSVNSKGNQPWLFIVKASSVAQSVKHLPAMHLTWVQFLGQEVPLEKEMATHSSILAWRIPWIEEPGRLQFMGSQELDTTWRCPYSL